MPLLWHFDFGGKDALRLVQGRERVYLDRFWNDFAGDPSKIDEGTRVHYARLYARPGAMRAPFAQFQSIRQDAADNAELVKTKLPMPVLAIGGEKSFEADLQFRGSEQLAAPATVGGYRAAGPACQTMVARTCKRGSTPEAIVKQALVWQPCSAM